jgi:tripartite-type tricarboxylate transporter receptor subunit TctC
LLSARKALPCEHHDDALPSDFLLAAGAAVLPTASRAAAAETYPARPVRTIVGFAAGGGTDLTARLIGQWLSERLGQPFIVENRPGGASNLAAEMVAHAPGDGYTLLLINPTNAINATLYDHLNFNFIRDIAPVASIMRVPLVMEVNPSLAVKSVPEFIAYAKSNPGKLNLASSGTGTPIHVAGELFKMMTSLDMVQVNYRGSGPALVDLLSGQVQVMFDAMPASLPHIKQGRLRPLAVTTANRAEALPDVPVLSESVPGYEASTWFGIGAPKDTPREIIDKLNVEINAALLDPKVKSRLADLGGTVFSSSPDDFGKLIADETEKWAKVVKFSGAKPD